MIKRNAIYRPAAETRARYRLLYGGAGSGKSVFTAQDFIAKLSKEHHRLIVFRKVASTIYNSTFTLFKDILDAMGRLGEVRVNEQRMSFTLPNGSQILEAGLDDVKKMKSLAQPTLVWVEEATELDFIATAHDESDLAQIDLRLRGVDLALNPSITLTFNPRIEAKKIFDYVGVSTADLPTRSHREYDDGRVYVQHTTHEDNRYVGEEYVSVFRKLGGVMQAVYERGELVAVDAPDQLVRYEWVKRAFELDRKDAEHDGRQRLAIDVARFGDDETVIGRFEGWALVAVEAVKGQDTTATGRRALSLARQYEIAAELIAVDTVGLGSGTADTMREDGLDVTEVIGGARPVDRIEGFSEEAPDFNNLRSQLWYFLRTQLEAGKVALAVEDEDVKRKIQEDLLAPCYRYGQEKRIEVEPKTGRSKSWGIKQRLGRSPDYGDMLAYGIFVEHLQPAESLFLV